ncbi:MAG: YeeE/YedE family protein [Rhodobacteraceae bacterium]|nr:YeeE/YedE family protein [Paracoccaceae bacterium]
MIETDWIWGLAGGLMIGVSAAIFLLGNGRIMGASGIIGGLVDRSGLSNWDERLAFLAALVVVPALLLPFYNVEVTTNITNNLWVIVAGGLLVGIGTRLANGCTSGHGVCGISRFSLRGIVSTVFYLLAGGIVMVLFRHLLGVI